MSYDTGNICIISSEPQAFNYTPTRSPNNRRTEEPLLRTHAPKAQLGKGGMKQHRGRQAEESIRKTFIEIVIR